MNNISEIKNCYGCGVCATVCPQKIIDIKLNKDGFYEPQLNNPDKCTHCGLCLSVCSYIDEKASSSAAFNVKSYASWSKDTKVRFNSSSGGVSYELGKFLIQKGYKACVVRYDLKKNRAEHFMASTIEEFAQSIGSKYIQSYTLDGFNQFNRKDKFFVTGTPCQIDSIRRYIKKLKIEDNFILMDFFCHGVPSMLMWQKYTQMVLPKTGKFTDVSWRNKITGWHDSWQMKIKGENKIEYQSWKTKGDLFYKMFLGNNCLGKACYDKCKYKMTSSAADIRIGDLWGSKYKENKDGVNAVLAMTSKGDAILHSIACLNLVSHPVEVVTEGQMKKNPKHPKSYFYVKRDLKNNSNIQKIAYFSRLIDRSFNLHRGIYNRISKKIKQIVCKRK